MPMEIPQTPEEHIVLMRKILAKTATPEEIQMANNLTAINDGVFDASVYDTVKTTPSASILRDAEIRAQQYSGTDIDSSQTDPDDNTEK